MVHLTLTGLSEDGTRLLLVGESGEEFTLSVDARLRAALRGDSPRRLEKTMDSTLRPRDIQARIRAGETPEAVAEAAQTSVERIMPYAGPVLAERAHVAERAQRSSVRRKAGEAGARTLGEAVIAQLQPHGVAGSSLPWDAWRREDGRWTLQTAYTAGGRSGTAVFTFDAPGNYVVTENDDARWLVGEAVEEPDEPAARPDDLSRARRRRLTAVGDEELPLGDDAIEIANEGAAADLSPTPEPLADEPAARDHPPVEPDEEVAGEPEAPQESPEQSPEEPPEQAAPRRSARRKGRASVPSWDEIMFGGGKGDRG